MKGITKVECAANESEKCVSNDALCPVQSDQDIESESERTCA